MQERFSKQRRVDHFDSVRGSSCQPQLSPFSVHTVSGGRIYEPETTSEGVIWLAYLHAVA